MLWEGGERFLVAKIGDPDVYLRYGTHVFEIRYTIDGVLDPGTTGANKKFADSTGDATESTSVFFWNVIAQAWNNEIERAEIAVTMPGEVGQAQCSVGFGVGRACTDLTISGNRVGLSATNLPPRTPVTLRAGVDVPTPPRAELPWSFTWDRVLGRSVGGVLWALALTAAAAVGAILWYRTTVEPSPGFPLQYAPPQGLGPVQTEYIRTESMPKNGLTATLFYLADRGLIDMRQVNEKQWTIRGKAEKGAWADVDRASLAVGAALKVTGPGKEFEAKKTATAGKKLSKAKTDMAEWVQKWAYDDGYMVKHKKELWVRVGNAIAFILMLCGFFRWGFPATMWALPFAAFFLFSAASWKGGVGSADRERPRTLVARRWIPPDADHRFGRGALRLRGPKGPLHGLCPVRGRRGRRGIMGEEVRGGDGSSCATTGLVSLVVDVVRRRLRRRLQWTELRQLRVGTVVVDRRIHRIAVIVLERQQQLQLRWRWWRRRRRRRRRRIMVRLLLVIVLALALAALVIFVLGYNKIRSAEVRVAEALSGIDVELTRRASLIPSLVHTVQTFAVHEKGILDHVTNARAALTSATSGKSVAQRSAAEKDLDSALVPLLALGQSYPQLNSSNNFLNLQDNLADTENKLAFARQYYNDSVATLNGLISTIPWMFVAPLTGVGEQEYYQTPR